MRDRVLPLLSFALLIGLAIPMSGCSTINPAMDAVAKNDKEGFRKALDSGVSPDYVENQPDSPDNGHTLLYKTIALGQRDMTDLLVQRGANPYETAGQWMLSVDRAGGMEGVIAEAMGDYYLSGVKTLVEIGLSPNVQFKSGRRPLHYSCSAKKIIGYLISKGAKVDESSGPWDKELTPTTPLGACFARIESENSSIQSSLESSERKGSEAYSEMFRSMAIMQAKIRDLFVDGARTLLEYGANPNYVLNSPSPKSSKTPLLLKAVELKQPRLVEALLEHGADVLIRSETTGETVLHGLAKNGDVSSMRDVILRAKLASRKQTRTSTEANQKLFSWLDQFSVEGKTAMHLAGADGRMNVIQVLIEHGADASLRNKNGRTPQQLVAEKIERDEAAVVAAKENYRRRMEKADDDARESAANRQGVLAVLGSVAIAKGMSGKNYTDDQRRTVIDSYVRDRVNAADGVTTDNLGQSVNTIKRDMDLALLSSQTRARMVEEAQEPTPSKTKSSKKISTTPRVETASAQPKTLAPTVAMRSGQVCGVGKRCVAGNGYTQWCSGPDTGGPHCVSECEMTSHVAYHDTELPNNVAYIPSGIACQPGCTVPNPCD